jgi:hypothetical protein
LSEFDYKQRPTTQDYRDNWDKVYSASRQASNVDALSADNTPEALAGSGVPACTGLIRKHRHQIADVLRLCRCGSRSFTRLMGTAVAKDVYVCNECGTDLW